MYQFKISEGSQLLPFSRHGRESLAPIQNREKTPCPWAQSRESSGTVSEGRAGIRRLAPKVYSQESGIEAVTGSNGIQRSDTGGGKQPALGSSLHQRTAFAALGGHQRDALCQGFNGALGIRLAGDPAGLVLIGQEDIDDAQKCFEPAAPPIFRIVIGIQRERKTLSFQLPEYPCQVRLKRLVSKERGEMEVPARSKVGH